MMAEETGFFDLRNPQVTIKKRRIVGMIRVAETDAYEVLLVSANHNFIIAYGLGFMRRLPPTSVAAVTNRRLYLIRLSARPFGVFGFSCFATFGVWPLTFPARASDPCTLPMM
jgi:hypothetical protein